MIDFIVFIIDFLAFLVLIEEELKSDPELRRINLPYKGFSYMLLISLANKPIFDFYRFCMEVINFYNSSSFF